MRGRRSLRPIRGQRGAAALVVTMLLVFAMLIVVAVGNRNAVVETRASANQYRSTQSFEAAEAGLEWALARLNDDTPIGDDCLPSADPAAPTFRERYLRDDGNGFRGATWDDAGIATPLQAACVRGAAGWSCSCPPSGPAVVADPEGSATVPVFTLRFADGPRPGIVRAIASGCTRIGAPCDATSTRAAASWPAFEVASQGAPARVQPLAIARTMPGRGPSAKRRVKTGTVTLPSGSATTAGPLAGQLHAQPASPRTQAACSGVAMPALSQVAPRKPLPSSRR